MSETTGPEVLSVKRHAGVAGQISITCDLAREGEETETATFVGSVYGGPIVWVAPNGHQIFISRDVTDRIGSELNEAWVRAFFGDDGTDR